METQVQPSGVFDFQDLARLRARAAAKTPEVKREAAQQFEALFLQSMLKSMREAGGNDGLMEGPQSELYRDWHDQQLAVYLARNGGIGFADAILRELGNKQSQPLDPEAREVDPVPLTAGRNGGSSHETGSFTFARTAWSAAGLKGNTPQKVTNGNDLSAAAEPRIGIGKGATDFVKSLWPAAVDAARELGTKPEAILALAALETGWGRHLARHSDGQSSHNLFGIKASRGWKSPVLAASTQEFENGRAVRRRELFRSYDSAGESVKDFVSLIKRSPRYAKALSEAHDPAAFLHGLQQAGYATDPNYARKLESIMNSRLMRVAMAEAGDSGARALEARQLGDPRPDTPVERSAIDRAAQGQNRFVEALSPEGVKTARERGAAPKAGLGAAALGTDRTRSEPAAQVVWDRIRSLEQDPHLASVRTADQDLIAFVHELKQAGSTRDPDPANKRKSLIDSRAPRAAIERLKESAQRPIA